MRKGEMNEIHNQGKEILRDTQSSSWGRSKQMSQGFTLSDSWAMKEYTDSFKIEVIQR